MKQIPLSTTHTVSAAKPYPYQFSLGTTALVIIDMQRDFVEPGGFGEALGNDVSPLQAIIPAIQAILNLWRQHHGLVIHTREAHVSDLSDCPAAKIKRGNPSLRIGDVGPMGRILVAGEAGNAIVSQLTPTPDEWQIDKPGKGMFYNTGLHERLQQSGISHLLFSGVTTEVCVQSSMREANDRGYECLILSDCTESYFPHFKAATLEMLTAQAGIVGWAATSEQLAQSINT